MAGTNAWPKLGVTMPTGVGLRARNDILSDASSSYKAIISAGGNAHVAQFAAQRAAIDAARRHGPEAHASTIPSLRRPHSMGPVSSSSAATNASPKAVNRAAATNAGPSAGVNREAATNPGPVARPVSRDAATNAVSRQPMVTLKSPVAEAASRATNSGQRVNQTQLGAEIVQTNWKNLPDNYRDMIRAHPVVKAGLIQPEYAYANVLMGFRAKKDFHENFMHNLYGGMQARPAEAATTAGPQRVKTQMATAQPGVAKTIAERPVTAALMGGSRAMPTNMIGKVTSTPTSAREMPTNMVGRVTGKVTAPPVSAREMPTGMLGRVTGAGPAPKGTAPMPKAAPAAQQTKAAAGNKKRFADGDDLAVYKFDWNAARPGERRTTTPVRVDSSVAGGVGRQPGFRIPPQSGANVTAKPAAEPRAPLGAVSVPGGRNGAALGNDNSVRSTAGERARAKVDRAAAADANRAARETAKSERASARDAAKSTRAAAAESKRADRESAKGDRAKAASARKQASEAAKAARRRNTVERVAKGGQRKAKADKDEPKPKAGKGGGGSSGSGILANLVRKMVELPAEAIRDSMGTAQSVAGGGGGKKKGH